MTVLDLLTVVGKKVKHILPKGGEMVIYHCRIRNKVTLNKSKTKATLMLPSGPFCSRTFGLWVNKRVPKKHPASQGMTGALGLSSAGVRSRGIGISPDADRKIYPLYKPFTLENMWPFFSPFMYIGE